MTPIGQMTADNLFIYIICDYLFNPCHLCAILHFDAPPELVDIIYCEVCRKGEANAGGSFGHRRRANRETVEAFALQLFRFSYTIRTIAYDEGDDMALADLAAFARQSLRQQPAIR